MKIVQDEVQKLKLAADDVRCFLVVKDTVWGGLRNGTIQIFNIEVCNHGNIDGSLLL